MGSSRTWYLAIARPIIWADQANHDWRVGDAERVDKLAGDLALHDVANHGGGLVAGAGRPEQWEDRLGPLGVVPDLEDAAHQPGTETLDSGLDLAGQGFAGIAGELHGRHE